MSKGARNRKTRGSTPVVGPSRKLARVRVYATQSDSSSPGYGSDVKTAQDVMGICALCTSPASLLLSHIVPKWAFKWHKAEGGVVHIPPSGAIHPRIQDGYKHYLLCEPCEILLGHSENELSKIGFAQPGEPSGKLRIVRSGGQFFYVAGRFKYLIQRALFGIVLKYHFAPTSKYRIHSKKHVAEIRTAVLTDTYPAYSEPFGIKWFNGTRPGANARAYAGVLIDQKSNGAAAATVSVGGIDWFIQLTSSDRHFIESSEPWALLPASLESRAAWFDDWDKHESDIPEDVWGMRSSDACPCGTGLALGLCCEGGWLRIP